MAESLPDFRSENLVTLIWPMNRDGMVPPDFVRHGPWRRVFPRPSLARRLARRLIGRPYFDRLRSYEYCERTPVHDDQWHKYFIVRRLREDGKYAYGVINLQAARTLGLYESVLLDRRLTSFGALCDSAVNTLSAAAVPSL